MPRRAWQFGKRNLSQEDRYNEAGLAPEGLRFDIMLRHQSLKILPGHVGTLGGSGHITVVFPQELRDKLALEQNKEIDA